MPHHDTTSKTLRRGNYQNSSLSRSTQDLYEGFLDGWNVAGSVQLQDQCLKSFLFHVGFDHVSDHFIVESRDEPQGQEPCIHLCVHSQSSLGWRQHEMFVFINGNADFCQRVHVGRIKG